MKSYIFLVALGLLVCTAHAQTPTDMPSPNSAATDAPSLPIDTMRHRQPTQSAVDQLTRNSASGKCERPNGRDDRLMKSSACTKSLPDHPLPGAINRGFFGLVANDDLPRAAGSPRQWGMGKAPAEASLPSRAEA